MAVPRRFPLVAAVGVYALLGATGCKPRVQPAGSPVDGRPAERLAADAARDYKEAPKAAAQRYQLWAAEAARSGGPLLRIEGEVVKVKRVKNAPGKRWLVLRNDSGVEVALLGEVQGTGQHAVGEVTRASSRKGRLVFVCRSITVSTTPGAAGGTPPPPPVSDGPPARDP